MAHKIFAASTFLFTGMLLGSASYADEHLIKLQNNPFRLPEIVTRKPEPVVVQVVPVVVEPEAVELDLIATLVSENNPMVIVNGELLAIGEEIDGLRLLLVREGEAVFSAKGKRYTFSIVDKDNE